MCAPLERFVACFLSLTLLVALAPAAPASPPPTDAGSDLQWISEDLFQLFEGWAGPKRERSLADLVLEDYPELLDRWSRDLRMVFPQGVFGYFQTVDQEAVRDYHHLLEDPSQLGDRTFLPYLIGWRLDLYGQLDRKLVIHGGGLDLETYLWHRAPEVLAELDLHNRPPAKERSFPEYLALRGVPLEVQAEAARFIASLGVRDLDPSICGCRMVAAITELPSSLQVGGYRHVVPRGNNRIKEIRAVDKRELGAAHSVRTERYIYHGLNEIQQASERGETRLRTRMLCYRMPTGSVEPCPAAESCRGEMKLLAEYGANLAVEVDTSGIWTRSSQGTTIDMARLLYDPPGADPERALFEKGVGVERVGDELSYDFEAMIQFAVAVTQIVLVATGTAGLDPGAIRNILRVLARVDEGPFFGIINHLRGDGRTEGSMAVNFHSDREGTFPFAAGETHLLRLESTATWKSRGYGGQSETLTTADSSYLMAAAFDDFVCPSGVFPPRPSGLWSYATHAGAFHDGATLAGLAADFFARFGLQADTSSRRGVAGVP